MAKAKAKLKKITSKELKEVKDQQTDINGILLNIGNAEVVKTQMVTKHIELQQAWKKMTQALEKKYGAVKKKASWPKILKKNITIGYNNTKDKIVLIVSLVFNSLIILDGLIIFKINKSPSAEIIYRTIF